MTQSSSITDLRNDENLILEVEEGVEDGEEGENTLIFMEKPEGSPTASQKGRQEGSPTSQRSTKKEQESMSNQDAEVGERGERRRRVEGRDAKEGRGGNRPDDSSHLLTGGVQNTKERFQCCFNGRQWLPLPSAA